MLTDYISFQIYGKFAFEPTPGQKKIAESLADWIADPDHERIFILDGYAGTGKTTLVAALVATLKELKIKPVLLAPTGRAAKVLSAHSGMSASTVHKRIYRQKTSTGTDDRFSLDLNRERDACFIVDEASMLSQYGSEGSLFGSGSVLDDLVEYVRAGTRCRLMLVGDSAQLPPVGHETSPALDPHFMRSFGPVSHNVLEEVMRHGDGSGILFNATLIRTMLEAEDYRPPRFDLGYPDMESIGGSEFMEKVEECYARYGREETMVITRSNRRANRFNEGIRRYVMGAEEEIESGDMLMIVKNNYHFAENTEEFPFDFIANGDTARLRRIRKFEELYGFRFAEARLTFPDYGDTELDCKLLLDTLSSESPSLTREQSNALFSAVSEDYADIGSKAKRFRQVRENTYYNAVQVKFAYAVTCHKAQGGEWKAVFIDRMLFGEEQMTRDLMRWLYTALTRATEKVYLVNFDERFTGPKD